MIYYLKRGESMIDIDNVVKEIRDIDKKIKQKQLQLDSYAEMSKNARKQYEEERMETEKKHLKNSKYMKTGLGISILGLLASACFIVLEALMPTVALVSSIASLGVMATGLGMFGVNAVKSNNASNEALESYKKFEKNSKIIEESIVAKEIENLKDKSEELKKQLNKEIDERKLNKEEYEKILNKESEDIKTK